MSEIRVMPHADICLGNEYVWALTPAQGVGDVWTECVCECVDVHTTHSDGVFVVVGGDPSMWKTV